MNHKGTNNTEKAISLTELIVVVLIVSILAVLAVPRHFRAREQVMDKEPQHVLQLIRAAERTYWMEAGHFWPPPGSPVATNIDHINSNLSLDIDHSGEWVYAISDVDGFTASASRSRGGMGLRSWRINASMLNATCTGSCL